MVTRVGDLPPHQGEAIAEEIILMHPTTFGLTRVPAVRFRGSSIFTGTDATPNPAWQGAAGGAFKEGDMFVQTNGQDVSMYQWHVGNQEWVQIADFNPPIYHTRESVGFATYELATIATMDNGDPFFSVGDYYRHTTLRRLYGPYHATTGFDFDPLNDAFVYERSAIEHRNIGAGRDIPAWNPSLMVDPIENAYYPLNGDTYIQELADPVHGGYKYTFDKVVYTADTGDHAAKLLAGWDVANRTYVRDSRVFNFPTSPADADHLTYITGDYWYNITNETLWGPYVGTADVATGTADDHRTAAWGAAPVRTKSSKLYGLDSPETNLYVPDTNDTLYTNGDMMVVENPHAGGPAPILYGPYVTGGAWPLSALMRGSRTFLLEQLEGVTGTYGAIPDHADVTDAYFLTTHGKPLIGDYIETRYVFPDGHPWGVAGELTGRTELHLISVDYVTGVVTKALQAYLGGVSNHYKVDTGRYVRDDLVFRTGDVTIDSLNVVYGPYVEGAIDDETAWPVLIAAPATDVRITQDTTGTVFQLNMDASGELYTVEL